MEWNDKDFLDDDEILSDLRQLEKEMVFLEILFCEVDRMRFVREYGSFDWSDICLN